MVSKLSGKFIVIDGSDGSGKKTQSDILVKKLKKAGHKVAYYDFPQYKKTLFGKLFARYLNGEFGEADDVSPYLTSLLTAGDRWQASEKIEKDLKAGKIVVSNRYIQSNMGFQGAKFRTKKQKIQFTKWLEELEYGVYGIPRADQVLYLYVPYKISQALVDNKSKRDYTKMKRDIHEKNSNFLRRVEKSYLELSEKYPEWKKIDCYDKKNNSILPIDEIAEKVLETVSGIVKIKIA